MRKVIVVAVREYVAAVKSKAFIITMLMMPVLMGGSLLAEKFLGDTNLDIGDKRIAVVDHTGVLYDELAAAAELRNAVDIYDESAAPDEPKQIAPRFILERVAPGADVDALLLDLSERVRNEELFAFVEIGANVLNATATHTAAEFDAREETVRYFSNAPTYKNVRRWLAGVLADSVQRWRFDRSGLDGDKVRGRCCWNISGPANRWQLYPMTNGRRPLPPALCAACGDRPRRRATPSPPCSSGPPASNDCAITLTAAAAPSPPGWWRRQKFILPNWPLRRQSRCCCTATCTTTTSCRRSASRGWPWTPRGWWANRPTRRALCCETRCPNSLCSRNRGAF